MECTTVYIDLNKISKNLHYYLNEYPDKKLILILKNNAYGLGMIRIAKHLEKEKVDIYGVFQIHEAKKLRQHNINKEILILGNTSYNDLEYCCSNNITISLVSLSQYYQIKKYHLPLKIHIKVDSGMHRLGIPPSRVKPLINDIKNHSSLILKGIYTHYIGGIDYLDYIIEQQKLFDTTLKDLNLDGLLIHDCSSNNIAHIKSLYANSYRIGMGLYNHEQVIVIKAPIINILRVKKYQCVSYDCSYVCHDDGYIATIPFGYGNGWIRNIPLHHYNYQQAGLMTMNMTMLFSLIYPQNKIVTIVGYGENNLKFYQDKYHVSIYEILSSLSSSLKRVYLD